MIKLNRMTDYAVVVMARMAMRPGGDMTAAQIARDTGVPLPTVAKLMTALARGGLAASQRGVAGGYRLARPAHAISVAEIITALEGPIALTACVDGAVDQCEVETLCPMRGNWDKVNRAIRRALQELTLADMTPEPIVPWGRRAARFPPPAGPDRRPDRGAGRNPEPPETGASAHGGHNPDA